MPLSSSKLPSDIKFEIKLDSMSKNNRLFDRKELDRLYRQMADTYRVPPSYFKQQFIDTYLDDPYYDRRRRMYGGFDTIDTSFREREITDADRKYFWKSHYLYKHKADETDEDGSEIFVYSIVVKEDWDKGSRKINEESGTYNQWAKNLPEEYFEEVAANWFESLVEESDIAIWQDSVIKIVP